MKLFLITIIFLTSSIAISAEDKVDFPSDWGKISNDYMQNTNCPNLEGRFAELGWRYMLVGGKEVTWDNPPLESYAVIGGDERYKKSELNQVDYMNSFSIQQQNAEEFNLTRLNKTYYTAIKSDSPVVTGKVNKAIDGLKCIDGWWVISTGVYDGSAEGHLLKMSGFKRFTRLNNRDLVVHARDLFKRTDLFIFTKETVWDTFYRYEFRQK
jgi:hypothetical protein